MKPSKLVLAVWIIQYILAALCIGIFLAAWGYSPAAELSYVLWALASVSIATGIAGMILSRSLNTKWTSPMLITSVVLAVLCLAFIAIFLAFTIRPWFQDHNMQLEYVSLGGYNTATGQRLLLRAPNVANLVCLYKLVTHP